MTTTTLPPVLLADATWYGTLAAARDLGSRGVPVTLAADSMVAPARWSRHVTRTVRCPPTSQPERFLEWLLDFGAKHPGHVLYPTSDDVAWIVATHREALSRHYQLYSPAPESLARLLDKSRLGAAARQAGLDVPETGCPTSAAEAAGLADRIGFPLFIKPRAQVLNAHVGKGRKGLRVDRAEDLVPRWQALRDAQRVHPMVSDHVEGLELPILQAACAAEERIYTVDGFVDESGQGFAALACAKVLQWPRRTGPGVCFEDQVLDPDIAEGLRRLCVAVGFHGVFDAEFLVQGKRRLFIDFNPRFYNHMAYEVDRGLPLPWLAYLAALGDREGLAAGLAAARAAPRVPRAYVHRLPTALMIWLQRLTGAMDEPRRSYLRGWISSHAGHITDPAWSDGDALPGLAEVALNLWAFLRHPRAFLRTLAVDEAPKSPSEALSHATVP